MKNYGTAEKIELHGLGMNVRIEYESFYSIRYDRPIYSIYIFSPRRGEWVEKGRRSFPKRTSYRKMYTELLNDWAYEGVYLEDEDDDHGAPWHYL